MKINESTIPKQQSWSALALTHGMEKCVESRLQKQEWSKFRFIDFVLTDRRSLSGKRLLEKFKPHCLSAIWIFQCFSLHNPRKWRQRRDVSVADWLY